MKKLIITIIAISFMSCAKIGYVDRVVCSPANSITANIWIRSDSTIYALPRTNHYIGDVKIKEQMHVKFKKNRIVKILN